MKVVKSKKKLLTKHLFIIVFVLFNSSILLSQLLPIGGPFHEIVLPTIDVSITSLDYQGMDNSTFPPKMLHNANLYVDLSLDGGAPLENVEEIGFDLRLENVTSGLFSPIPLGHCNGGTLIATQDEIDSSLFHIVISFPNGFMITEENPCAVQAVALVSMVVDGRDILGRYNTPDCYDDPLNTFVAGVEITNSYVYNFKTTPLNNVYYTEEFGAGDCTISPLEDERKFDINIAISDFATPTVSVDVYFRYSDGIDLSTINYGKIWIAHIDDNFYSPTFVSSPEINAGLWLGNGLSTITFNNTSITKKSLTQVYVGTLTYELIDPSVSSISTFYVALGEFNDQDGALTSNATGLHDTEDFNYDIGLSKMANPNLQSSNIVNAYPVPAKNYVVIQTNFDLNEHTQIEIFDAAGKKMMQMKFDFEETRQIQLNIEDLDKGIYMVMMTNHKFQKSLKIFKQ